MKKEPSACAAPGSFFVVDEKPQRKRGLSHPNAASVDPISVGSPSVCIHGTVFSLSLIHIYVFSEEAPAELAENKLVRLPNVLSTPHIAGYSYEAHQRNAQACVEHLRRLTAR